MVERQVSRVGMLAGFAGLAGCAVGFLISYVLTQDLGVVGDRGKEAEGKGWAYVSRSKAMAVLEDLGLSGYTSVTGLGGIPGANKWAMVECDSVPWGVLVRVDKGIITTYHVSDGGKRRLLSSSWPSRRGIRVLPGGELAMYSPPSGPPGDHLDLPGGKDGPRFRARSPQAEETGSENATGRRWGSHSICFDYDDSGRPLPTVRVLIEGEKVECQLEVLGGLGGIWSGCALVLPDGELRRGVVDMDFRLWSPEDVHPGHLMAPPVSPGD